jgi:poly(A) polymerase
MDELLLLSRADVTSKRPGRRRAALANVHQLSGRLRDLDRAAERSRPVLPRGLGAALIKALGLAPGPAVGRLRARCEAAARDGRLPEMPSAEACVAWLAAHPDN